MPPALVTYPSTYVTPKAVKKKTCLHPAHDWYATNNYSSSAATTVSLTSPAVTYYWVNSFSDTTNNTLTISGDWWADSEPDVIVQPPAPVIVSPEAERVRRRAHATATLAAEDVRKEANGRARRLLIAHLNPQQRDTLDTLGYFDVLKGDRFYRIFQGRSANILVYVRHGLSWKPDHVLCCHPRDYLPDEDTMLTQKFMIEVEEQQFKKTANRHPLDGHWGRHYLGELASAEQRAAA